MSTLLHPEFLATERRVAMFLQRRFWEAVLASVAAYYIGKWLDLLYSFLMEWHKPQSGIAVNMQETPATAFAGVSFCHAWALAVLSDTIITPSGAVGNSRNRMKVSCQQFHGWSGWDFRRELCRVLSPTGGIKIFLPKILSWFLLIPVINIVKNLRRLGNAGFLHDYF